MAGSMQFFDSIALAAVVHELSGLGDARIDKVGQPSPHELYLNMRAGGRNVRVYLSVREAWSRCHLTNRALGNMPVPTAFTMLLRKHLEGSRLLRVEQLGLERVVRFVVAGRDELGDPFERVLVAELIGKYANLFLLDHRPGRDDMLLGCMRAVTEEMCQARQLAPGLPYAPPPVATNKTPFPEATEATFLAALQAETKSAKLVDRLSVALAGISKVALAQLVAEAGFAPDVTVDALEALDPLLSTLSRAQKNLAAGRFAPRAEAGPQWAYTMWWLGDVAPVEAASPSAVLEGYYEGLEAAHTLAEQRRKLGVELGELVRKQRERLNEWERTLAKAEEADRHRELGDLLTSHMYLLTPGLASVTVTDFYHPEAAEVTIPLDPQLTGSENAQRFFKRYQKARNSREAVTGLLASGREEMGYLEAVAHAIATATEPRDLKEIAEELAALTGKPLKGMGAKAAPRRGAAPEPPPKPLCVTSSDGLPIYVGKNNKQNEHVTFKLAHSNDWWLHTQNIPGSHVVIRSEGDVPERTLHEAANLAAFFSQARASAQVPVVYTRRKHVKKPRGAKPGMVIYEQEKTLFVTPDAALVEAQGLPV